MSSLRKNLLLLLLSSVLFVSLLELAAGRVYSSYSGRPFVRSEVQARLLGEQRTDEEQTALETEVQQLQAAQVFDQSVIIHPYFGFVNNPGSPGINDYGFFGESPETRRRQDVATVAIFGGSVADQLFYMARETLIRELQRGAYFRGKEIAVISTALGGYKQPQQLQILSYLLAMGVYYDIVINLDGFNEVDLAYENVGAGVHPLYPYRWNVHARQGLDTVAMGHAGRIEIIRERRKSLRRFFAHWPLRSSAFFLTLWDALDRRQQSALHEQTRRMLARVSTSEVHPRVRGPQFNYPEDGALYWDVSEVWLRSSMQMRVLCESRGIEYFHFLQPNQYVPKSKTLSEEEQKIAYDPAWSGSDRIPRGYPYLVERGAELQSMGVRFVDLSMIFRDENRTVYDDTCCHVNQLGADLLAKAVATAVLDELH